MRAALDAAAAAASMGEVPVGAVVVLDGRVIATAANAPRTRHDPTAHAEMLAIRAAAEAIGDDRLSDCDLWVTLEPWARWAGAGAHAPRARREYVARGAARPCVGAWGVSLEPCALGAGALAHARIARLYYGAPDPKGGAVEHGPRLFAQPTVHHRPEIYPGIGEEEAARLLRDFFAVRRGERK